MNASPFVRFARAAACVLVLGFSKHLFAFPGSPLPLYELWKQSDAILFADVISTVNDGAQQRASLSVVTVLKGDAAKVQPFVTVFTQLGGCPYPHAFKASERILLFLAWDSEELMFTPVGASEAIISTDATGLKHYKSALDELPKIYKLPEDQRIREALLRWSVRCSLNPVTRQEGLWSLACAKPRDTPSDKWLLPEESELLIRAITNESTAKETLGIIELMISHPTPSIDNVLLNSLTKCNDDSWSPIARIALHHLPERLGVSLPPDLRDRLGQYWERESDFYWGAPKHSNREKKRIKSSLDTEFGWLCANVWRECASHTEARTKR
ncbi:MAG: hypothetical protein KF777_23965 [Planctomycetaceae bacterium]|nr:hypothetical protein [Planctomycetaceae bacterium]